MPTPDILDDASDFVASCTGPSVTNKPQIRVTGTKPTRSSLWISITSTENREWISRKRCYRAAGAVCGPFS
jgi:hypothetical protein